MPDENVERGAPRAGRAGAPERGEDLSGLPPDATNVGRADAGIGEGQTRKKGVGLDDREAKAGASEPRRE